MSIFCPEDRGRSPMLHIRVFKVPQYKYIHYTESCSQCFDSCSTPHSAQWRLTARNTNCCVRKCKKGQQSQTTKKAYSRHKYGTLGHACLAKIPKQSPFSKLSYSPSFQRVLIKCFTFSKDNEKIKS